MTAPLTLFAARFIHLAAVLLVAGCATFRWLVLPRVLPLLDAASRRRVLRRQAVLAAAGFGVAACAGLAWVAVQSASMADAAGLPETLAAVRLVLAETTFGHAVLLRAGLLLLAALAWRARRVAAMVALAAAAAQAGMGHGIASGDRLLPLSIAVHVAAAGAWLGGLVPLALLMRDAPGPGARRAAEAFSPLGMVCVAALAATAYVQGRALIGAASALTGTVYGLAALMKLALFLALIGIAGANRRALTTPATRPAAMRRRIATETALGIVVIATATWLSHMEPGIGQASFWSPF